MVPSPRRNLQATAEKIESIVASKKAAPKKGTITPQGRQKLAEAMKKRWAVKRANSVAKKKVVKKAK